MPDTTNIGKFVQGFAKHIKAYKSKDTKEAEIRQQFIDPFWRALGWVVGDTKHVGPTLAEVIIEKNVETAEASGLRNRRPDYLFRLGGFPRFVVEAKKPAVDIDDDKTGIFQAKQYAWNSTIPFAILTDFEQFRLFDTTLKPIFEDPHRGLVKDFKLDFNQYVSQWDVTLSPGTYFVSAADALAVTSAVDAFEAAYNIAKDPEGRTPVNVLAKDEARAAAEGICRQFASLIKVNAGIGNPEKVAAGVRPVNTDREPIECPQTAPLVSPIAATPGSHTVRYSDSLTPDSRAKPFGASDLLLFCCVADDAVDDPGQAKFVGKFTKNPISVEFAAGDNGKQATYFARWSSRKGEVGPWSLPVSMAIAA